LHKRVAVRKVSIRHPKGSKEADELLGLKRDKSSKKISDSTRRISRVPYPKNGRFVSFPSPRQEGRGKKAT
jgi:hypothetical protein